MLPVALRRALSVPRSLRCALLPVLVSVALFACVKRTPCDQTVGAHVCSMVPEHYSCSCDGTVEPARESDQPVACGHVETMCVGRVTESRPTSSLLSNFSAVDAGAPTDATVPDASK